MLPFEFATANRIIFGKGKLREIGTVAAPFGTRALLVVGGMMFRAAPLISQLSASGVEVFTYMVEGEPKISTAEEGARRARDLHCDLVIGFGGGSAIDCGKAVAAFATNHENPLHYLEVVGAGQPLTEAPLPYIAIPTTAGTGAEVTRNAVLASPEHQVKVSLRHPLMLPVVALIDPELTYSLPPEITASTGLDALTQVIEPLVCVTPNPITDALCREGIRRASGALKRAFHNGLDAEAREEMAVVSLFGGLALANARLGAVHGFAAPIGGMYNAPHGAACAALLPHVMEVNIQALRKRDPQGEALRRYEEIARLVTHIARPTPEDGVMWIRDLCSGLRTPPLATYGVQRSDFPTLIERATNASSMKGNPITLTPAELKEILDRAL